MSMPRTEQELSNLITELSAIKARASAIASEMGGYNTALIDYLSAMLIDELLRLKSHRPPSKPH